MAARSSTTKRTNWRAGSGRKSSLRKIAMANPGGNARISAMSAVATVPTRKGSTP
jgi:hypothetical protein